MKLKELMIKELTVAEKDYKNFKKIKPELDQLFDDLENVWNKIGQTLSDLNSPGLRNSFRKGIIAMLKSSSGNLKSKLGKEELQQYERDNFPI